MYKKKNHTVYHKKVTSEEFNKSAINSKEQNYIPKLAASNKRMKTSNGSKDKTISKKIETKENLPNLKINIQDIFSNDENKKKAMQYLMQIHKEENKSSSTNFNKMLNKIPEKDKQAKLKTLETNSNSKQKKKFIFIHKTKKFPNFQNSFRTLHENKKFIIDDEPLNQNDIYFDNNINPINNFNYSNKVFLTDVNDYSNNDISKARDPIVLNGQQKILNVDLDDFTFKNNYNEYINNSNKCKMRILNKYIIINNNTNIMFKKKNIPFQSRNNTNYIINNNNNSSNNKSNCKNVTCDKDNIIEINSMKNLYRHHNIYSNKKSNYNILNNNPTKDLYHKKKSYFDLSGNKDIQIINEHIQNDLKQRMNKSVINNEPINNENNGFNICFCDDDFDDLSYKNSFKRKFFKFFIRNNQVVNDIQLNLNKKINNKDNGMIINKDKKDVEWKIMGMMNVEEGNNLKRKNKELYYQILKLKTQIEDLKKENEKLKDDIINNMIINGDDI